MALLKVTEGPPTPVARIAPAGQVLIKELDGACARKVMALIYGFNGSGKTSIARDCHSIGGKTLILATDANYAPLGGKKYVVDIESWEQFSLAVEKLPYDQFDTIAVDTVTQLIDLVQVHECRRLGIEHPSDAEFSKGWQAMRVELGRVLTKMELRAKNVIYLAQEKSEEVSVVPGRRTVKALAALAEGSGRRVRGVVSLVGRIEVDPKTHNRSLDFRFRADTEGKDTQSISANQGFVIPATGADLWNLVHGPVETKES